MNLDTGKRILSIRPHGTKVDPSDCKEVIPIPCGRCIGCRLDRSRQWADRCMLELMYHEQACFVTLTYDDFHIPRRFYGDPRCGNVLPCFTLCIRDLQLFFKRLRKRFPSAVIRYFGCGEYGPRTLRPHYHIILFGIDFDDKVEIGKSKTGQVMYSSETLDSIWSFPPRNALGESYSPNKSKAGIATVQPVTWETCAYTARYVQKKLYGYESKFYEEHNIDPPFSVMSRRPGIGRRYLDDHPDLFEYDNINIATAEGGKKIYPPKYFTKCLEISEPEKAEALKNVKKQLALERQALLESKLEIPYETYLHQQNDIKLKQIKSLKRGGVS